MGNLIKLIECAEVLHKTYGMGWITSFDNHTTDTNIIIVEFRTGVIKKFSFPLCFINNHLELTDVDLKVKFDHYFSRKETDSALNKREAIIDIISNIDLYNNLAINTIISLYEDKKVLEILIIETSTILLNYYKYRKISQSQQNVIIFTFAWLSYDNYDGKFWEFIRSEFSMLYKTIGNQQDLERAIREVISDQERYEDSRLITNVLVHAGVPKHFLKKFYDFVFDIYKVNFDYQISGQSIDEILYDSLEGLSLIINQADINDDKLQLNVTQKTYVLIKSTKLALIYYKESVVNILKTMLDIVDTWYYDITQDFDYPQQLLDKFDEWKAEITIKPALSGERNQDVISKPQYVFNSINRKIKIFFPNYSLKKVEVVDFDAISVEKIIDDQRVLLEKNQYKIIEKIGFNSLQILPQELEYISSNITFNVCKEGVPIISTNNSLQRKFIIFDENGQERGNYREYDKLVYVAFPKDVQFHGVDNPKILYDSIGYNIAVFMADKNNIYSCGAEPVCFSGMLKPGVYGREVKTVIAFVRNRKVSVFTQVSNFVFESENQPEDLIVKLNNTTYELNKLRHFQTRRGVFWNYNISIDQADLSSNLNVIGVFNKKNLLQELRSEEFLIDNKLDFLMLETESELEKDIITTSSFQAANVSQMKFSFATNTYFIREFRIGNNNIKYIFDPAIKRFKWSLEDEWSLLYELELKNRKTLYLSSLENVIYVLTKQRIVLPSCIAANDDNGFSSLETSYLSQLKPDNEYVFLKIEDCLDYHAEIKIYLRQSVISHKIFPQINGACIIEFDIKNFQENSLFVILKHVEKTVFSCSLLQNTLLLENIQPYTQYTLEIFEKENLFLGISSKIIYSELLYVNDATRLLDKSYYIKQVFIYTFDNNGNCVYESKEIKPVVIRIKSKLDKKHSKFSCLNIDSMMSYCCDFYKLDKFGKLISFSHLNKIYIEVISKKTSSILNVYAEDSGGDGLQLSNRNPKFMVDSEDEVSSFSIDYLVIDTERDEYN